METTGQERLDSCLRESSEGKDVAVCYNEWAVHYDEDIYWRFGPGMYALFDAINKYIPKRDASILDIGAGTGFGGKELKKLGYTNIEAVDASLEMLKIAERDAVYSRSYCHFVGCDPLPIPDACFDCVISMGAIAPNHLPAKAVLDLHRVLKPGGYIAIQCNYNRWCKLHEYSVDMAAIFDNMVAEAQFQRVESRVLDDYIRTTTDETYDSGFLCMYKKL